MLTKDKYHIQVKTEKTTGTEGTSSFFAVKQLDFMR